MSLLAIATSIDALVAGFALAMLDINLNIACNLVGLTTFVFSCIGVYIGVRSGARLEGRLEVIGGVILIIIAIKILL